MRGLFRKIVNKNNISTDVHHINLITSNPLNAGLHFAYGRDCLSNGQIELGVAELRTAVALGMDASLVMPEVEKIQSNLCDINQINHNRYFRMKTIADTVTQAASDHSLDQNRLSVLDIGGGEGLLNRMFPDAIYCLADPVSNGISALDLPFTDKSFDFVVANHVFEHIHISMRPQFLDSLCSKARKEVILLNPFYIEKTLVRQRLALFYKITGAEWAREHLECEMPQIDEIRDYADRHSLRYSMEPNGTMAVTMAIEYADYFAGKAECQDNMAEINRFYNEKLYQILDSTEYPNAYLIRIVTGSST